MTNEQPIEAVKKVIINAYINGIHGNLEMQAITAGFHKDFAMLVPENDSLKKVSVTEWIEFITNKAKIENPDLWNSETEYIFDFVDITNNAASVKIQVYKGDKHFSTDYMLLYRFPTGWKIVSKIFELH